MRKVFKTSFKININRFSLLFCYLIMCQFQSFSAAVESDVALAPNGDDAGLLAEHPALGTDAAWSPEALIGARAK